MNDTDDEQAEMKARHLKWLENFHSDTLEFIVNEGLGMMDRFAAFRGQRDNLRRSGEDTRKPSGMIKIEPGVWLVRDEP
jgi:hypothetical protein